MTKRLRRVGGLLAPALGLLLAASLAACGGDDADANGEGAGDIAGTSNDPILAFYQCLRDGGLDVADPDPGGPVSLGGLDPDDPWTRQIIQDCAQTHMSDSSGRVSVGGNMGENLADAEALIEFVDCMRGHGIDMPDPGPDGRLTLPDDFDPHDPSFQRAGQDCAQYLGGGGVLIGDGSSGGMVTQR